MFEARSSNGQDKVVQASSALEDLKSAFDECLANIETSGSFCVDGSVENAPNPGLYITKTDVGTIGLPLSDRDAQAIVSVSHQAPFGKGEQTIVDTSVRKTWELSKDDFEMKNPAWNTYVQSILNKVGTGLGFHATSDSISAQLYKLLLYGPGAMFKAHQDSEKEQGMFGTLVIALPSKHEGGQVHLGHAGKTEVLTTATNSDYGYTYLAWFSDVVHEVKPVTSGHRLVLTYNLVHTSLGSQVLSAGSDTSAVELDNSFQAWKTLDRTKSPKYLSYLLEHEYTEANFSLQSTKGHDNQVLTLLHGLCQKYDCVLYLASLQRTVTGGCADDGSNSEGFHDIDDPETTTTLTRVVDVYGKEIGKQIDLNEKYIIQHDYFEDLEPDDEEYEGWMGNEGQSATQTYQRSIAIFMPRLHHFRFMLGDTESIYTNSHESTDRKLRQWLQTIGSDVANQLAATGSIADLKEICNIVIDLQKQEPEKDVYWKRKASLTDETLQELVSKALLSNDSELFSAAYHACDKRSFISIYKDVGRALMRFNDEDLFSNLSVKLSTMKIGTERIKICQQLQSGISAEASLDHDRAASFNARLDLEIGKALEQAQLDTNSAGVMLANMSSDQSITYIRDTILPAIMKNAQHTAMMLSYSSKILKPEYRVSAPEEAKVLFDEIFTAMMNRFSLGSLGEVAESAHAKSGVGSYAYPYFQQNSFRKPEPDYQPDMDNSNDIRDILVYLCHEASTTSGSDRLKLLSSSILKEATTGRPSLQSTIFLPVVQGAIAHLGTRLVNSSEDPLRLLVKKLLLLYVTRVVQVQPVSPSTWTVPTVSCTCNDCKLLNNFLQDPKKQVERFAMAEKRRRHIESEVYGRGYTFDTERTKSPHTLVITKRHGTYLKEKDAWTKRRQNTMKIFQALSQDVLREIFKSEYQQVVKVDVQKLLAMQRALLPTSIIEEDGGLRHSSGNRILPPIAKRKIPTGEVIVLDDD